VISLDRVILKEIPFQSHASWDLVERIIGSFPDHRQFSADNPEWRPTETLALDLSRYGYGLVHVKNEADLRSNPTGTAKDRPAHEVSFTNYDWAQSQLALRDAGKLNGNIDTILVPRVTILSSGNWAISLARAFEKRNLPPPKVVLGTDITEERLALLMKERLDLYQVDLRQSPLSARDLLEVSNNIGGLELTSTSAIAPWENFYDWHVPEVMNQGPNEIFVPYGAGRMFESFVYWQMKYVRGLIEGKPDDRLKVGLDRILDISILGAEPEKADSKADKLTKPFNPFVKWTDVDIEGQASFSFTGKDTKKYSVKEPYILEAYRIMAAEGIATSYSGAAGLALYMQRFDEGIVDQRKKAIIINTGKGI
jgi:hypothetical protein